MTAKNEVIDFIGIGAAKSGSSWTCRCLREHPDILFFAQKSRKELNFFGHSRWAAQYAQLEHSRGREWYLAQFPEAVPGKVRGEFSNSYLWDEAAPGRIFRHFPEVKLLVVLRNPVELVYSLYWWLRVSVLLDLPDTFSEVLESREFLELGFHSRHLRGFRQYFPEDAFHIVLLDDIKRKPDEVVRKLYEFLEVRTSFLPSVIDKKVNPAIQTRFRFIRNLARGGVLLWEKVGLSNLVSPSCIAKFAYPLYYRINIFKKNYPPMQDGVRARLVEIYRSDVKELEKLLNRDLTTLWGFR